LMRALITRPREDSERLAEALAKRGIESLIEPLLTVVPVADAPIALDRVQALLFTSANGARAFATRRPERHLATFAVGDATAVALRAAGFTRVESAGGDVEDLARLVKARLDPTKGALLHIAGTAVAGDLAGVLRAAGFAVERAALYLTE